MDYYSAIKKNEILPFASTWMNLEGITLSEISQAETNTVWFHLYVESKKQMNKHNKTETDLQIQVVARRDGGGGRKEISEGD